MFSKHDVQEMIDDKIRYEEKQNLMEQYRKRPVYCEYDSVCPTCGTGLMNRVPKSETQKAHLRCFHCGQIGYENGDYKYQYGD